MLRGIAPHPEVSSAIKHTRQSNALDGKNSNFILPPQEDLQHKSKAEGCPEKLAANARMQHRQIT
jgi:hypothetical protein